ncbi:MAG: 23S rRNA (cytosine1962-C5)-methyltransferase [bacterium]
MAVKLTTVGERSVRSGHPWIFTDSIEKINKEGSSGDIAIIFSHSKNKAIGVGLYDPDSPIRIKMLHHDGGAKLDTDFFLNKINKAFAIRVPLLATNTNSYRLIFGENDSFPGLIADVYNKVLVVKLYSAIWFPYLEIILKQLIEVSQVKTVVLRLSRSLQQMNNTYGLSEGQVIFGTLTNEVIPFVEHGVNFSANVIKGHKTGYFLDHRDNRKRVGALSKNKTVLDVFSYAGGFSVHALVNQAKEVTSVDISKQALALAIENGKLNSFRGAHKTLAGDAFEILRKLITEKKTFDVVVIDPPSFAKSKSEIDIAKKKYRQLAELGVQLTSKGGVLVIASCSSRIVADSFFQINKEVLDHQSRSYILQNKTQHDVDHPISFKEGAYLKTGYYHFTK